uniref:RING-type E3 ubiquitin transferase n=1 Tax=Aegilops tauschii subsp. strangulata TaxID=200361 RepID=A0A453QMA4_AEGTS
APSDGLDCCPICLHDDDDNGAWKETPCGHRFHGRCVEWWLQDKGSCPMCRRQVVTMPATTAISTYDDFALWPDNIELPAYI